MCYGNPFTDVTDYSELISGDRSPLGFWASLKQLQVGQSMRVERDPATERRMHCQQQNNITKIKF